MVGAVIAPVEVIATIEDERAAARQTRDRPRAGSRSRHGDRAHRRPIRCRGATDLAICCVL